MQSIIYAHLEFEVPVWNPYLKKDIDKIEDIQHKVTRLVPTLSKMDYKDRLKELRLTTLETRRRRWDVIQFYKVLNGLDQIIWRKSPEKTMCSDDKDFPDSRNLRRGGLCFHREPANICTSRNEFFLNRVIPLWNELPQKVREATILNLSLIHI